MPIYERKTSDIYISDSFRKVLLNFSDQSDVAKTLLYRRLNTELLKDNHVNYISVSTTDPSMISYLSKDRIKTVEDSPYDDYWTSTKRTYCKPGTFIGKILEGIAPKDIEKFANLYKTFAVQKEFTFKVVNDKDIKTYYHKDSYFRQDGSLGSSCMKDNDCQDYFDMYIENDCISMLLMVAPNYKLIGRALLWNNGVDKIMDRIYTISDEDYSAHFTKWASDNGYLYKVDQNWCSTIKFTNGKESSEKLISFDLKSYDYEKYPYLDTFKWLDKETGMIFNYKPEHFDPENDSHIVITFATGESTDADFLTLDFIDREYGYKVDMKDIGGNRWTSQQNCRYSESNMCWIAKSEAKYSEKLEDWVFSDVSLNNREMVKKRYKSLNKKGRKFSEWFSLSFVGDSFDMAEI